MPEIGNTSVFSQTDSANNTSTDPGWPEGMASSRVNDAARALQGAIARDWQWKGPTVTSAGTNTVTLTYSVAPAAYYAGMVFSFIAGGTNTGAVTLNVNSLGAKNVYLANAALTGGEILSGKVYQVAYDGTQFQMISPPGTGRGGLIGVQVFATPGTATYTPTAGTNSVVVEVQAGGGGSGGVASTSGSQSTAAGGGGGGGYARERITSSFSGVTVTVGDGGTAGSAGANNGSTGGSSSFGALVSATGGGGGGGGSATVPTAIPSDGGTGGVGSGGDINVNGHSGGSGITLNTGHSTNGGQGGSSVLGGGVRANQASAAGVAGVNYGGGASGAANLISQSTRAGAKGGQGVVIVWEYA